MKHALLLILCLEFGRSATADEFSLVGASAGVATLLPEFDRVMTDPASPSVARREILLRIQGALRAAPPPELSPRELDLKAQRTTHNPLTTQTLLGHFCVVFCTDAFAARAKENDFVGVIDLAYIALAHLWGKDAMARSGNRFIIYAEPAMPGGHRCQGLALQIAIGRADADNADWFERFFHELAHGFQYAHPAGCYFISGFGEGWAEFCQASTCEYLSPLGAPFAGRFEWYVDEFKRVAALEYINTRLPIEEIISYGPSSGLIMELMTTTLDGAGRPDWAPLRRMLSEPATEQAWAPWHHWPAQWGRAAMGAFGAERARPILLKYRVPVDAASISAVESALSRGPVPNASPRTAVREWSVLGPVANPKNMGIEWNPFDIENLAARSDLQGALDGAPAANGARWRSDVRCDENGFLHLRDDWANQSEFYACVTQLPAELRGPVTLYISSDDDVALYLDGRLVHLFRGSRTCTPDYPDVAFALNDGPGRVVVVVVNHGAPAALSLAVGAGASLHAIGVARLADPDPAERAAACAYLGSRRMSEPLTRPLLLGALNDSDASVRAAAAHALGGIRSDPAVMDAIAERADTDPDTSVKDTAAGAMHELVFRRPIDGMARRTWAENRAQFARSSYVEAEYAWRLGTINAGFFGNNTGAFGGQCVNRGWGSDPGHFFSLVLDSHDGGPHVLRFRYAHPYDGGVLTVRLRRGVETLLEKEVTLEKTRDWTTWRWHEMAVGAVPEGRVYVEFVQPRCTPVIDVVGIEGR